MSRPTHSQNHTLDLILSHGIDVSGIEILQQSDDISDNYLVLCIFHIPKAVNPARNVIVLRMFREHYAVFS